MKLLASLAIVALTTSTAFAQPASARPARPVVVELFTSQACSDCPPADALLGRLKAADPDILPLDLHVTYWNSAAWRDPYASQAATQLQNRYAALRHSTEVYTPQAVVDGHTQFVGSNRSAMISAITSAKAQIAASHSVPVSLGTDRSGLAVHVGAGKGAATVWLFGFDPMHTTHVRGGENGGATLTEVNVVRSITRLGAWHGQSLVLHDPRPAGTQYAVLVQTDDGTILGAATQSAVAAPRPVTEASTARP